MSKPKIAYFSKMFQAVPAIVPVQEKTGGTFVVSRQSTQSACKKMFPSLATVRYRRWMGRFNKGLKILDEADIIVTGSPYPVFLEPFQAKKYMLFHGTYMMMSPDTINELTHFDMLFLTGPRMKQMLSRSKHEFNSHVTGFLPFALFPEKNSESRKLIFNKLGLDPDKKTIVYTPSRKKIGSWSLCAEDLVDQISGEFNLVLRPHPSQALTAKGDDNQSYKRIISKISNVDNVILDLITCSLPELQSIADLMISDANSPAEESLFYDVPQLFVETEKFSRGVVAKIGESQNVHQDDINQLLTLYDCGPSTDGKQKWLPIICNALECREYYRWQREKYFSWVFGSKDRNAADRVAKIILG